MYIRQKQKKTKRTVYKTQNTIIKTKKQVPIKVRGVILGAPEGWTEFNTR